MLDLTKSKSFILSTLTQVVILQYAGGESLHQSVSVTTRRIEILVTFFTEKRVPKRSNAPYRPYPFGRC